MSILVKCALQTNNFLRYPWMLTLLLFKISSTFFDFNISYKEFKGREWKIVGGGGGGGERNSDAGEWLWWSGFGVFFDWCGGKSSIDGGKPYLMVLIWDLMLLLFYQPVVIFYESKWMDKTKKNDLIKARKLCYILSFIDHLSSKLYQWWQKLWN